MTDRNPHRRRLPFPRAGSALAAALLPALLGACAGEGIRHDSSHLKVGLPATAEVVKREATAVLSGRFPLAAESERAGHVETEPVVENIVPGSQLDRYRRRAVMEVVPEKEGASVYLQIALEESASATPFLYTGPNEVSWRDLGRDETMEMEILTEIDRRSKAAAPETPALGTPPETPPRPPAGSAEPAPGGDPPDGPPPGDL